MAPREAYVRAVVKLRQCEMIAGLEIRGGDCGGDCLSDLRATLQAMMAISYGRLGFPTSAELDYDLAQHIEAKVIEDWPDRAYFLEVGIDADREGWVQVYQPFGLPRKDRQ